jgi:spore coat protein CotH
VKPAPSSNGAERGAEKALKRELKRRLDARRALTSWERYRALRDALNEGLELVDLADHKARFAFVILGALNVALYLVASRGELIDRIPDSLAPWLAGSLALYGLVGVFLLLQAIEALRPRSLRPQLPPDPRIPVEDHPAGIRYFHDVLERDVAEHLRAWREIRISQLNAELARQTWALARINQLKYRALDRLYLGLKVMTLLGAGLLLLLAAAAPARAQNGIFDPAVLHETRIEMDAGDWRGLRENFRENQYYACDIRLDGETIRQAGIRSRGDGSRNELKPGIKVEFDKYVEQELQGYKSLVLDNLVQDPAMLRERLAFQVFEAMGIAAPQNSFTRLYVNGDYWGLYALVEPVSKPFLRSRLGQDGGNLYDYEWAFAYDFSYLGSDPSRYVPSPFEPETNEDEVDARGLVAFIRAINETPDEGFIVEMERYLDLRAFVAYLAVENAIAENDGLTGYDGINNFYLYQYGGQDRFVFIPWDKDSAFLQADWPLFQSVGANVLVRRLLEDPRHRSRYQDDVAAVVGEFVNADWLLPRLEEAYEQIRSSAIEDGKKPFTNEEFEIGVDSLRAVIEGRRRSVSGQLE